METEQSSSSQNIMETETKPQQIGLRNNKLFVIVTASVLLTAIVVGLTVYFWQKSANGKAINDLEQKISSLERQISSMKNADITPQPTPQPTSSTPIGEPATKQGTSNVYANSFNYNNFTITYPDDWILSDMSINKNFPLKERLSPLYDSDSSKVIALSKNDVYLIVTIEKESGGGAGGIFIKDGEYEKFISNKDKVLIGNSVFYLNRSHSNIPSLLESEGGPYVWGDLTEYFPEKLIPQTGKTYKGYENVIKRNGFAYNFIVASNVGGNTDPQLQKEIISILETIEW